MVIEVFGWYFQFIDVGFFQLFDVVGCDVLIFFNNDFVIVVFDVECCNIIMQVVRYQFQFVYFCVKVEFIGVEEYIQYLFGGVI